MLGGTCRSVAAVRGLLLPRPRGLISGHARGRWNFTAVSLTRAPFAGSADRIPNPALPRKPEKRQLGPPSPGGSRAPPSRAVGRGVPPSRPPTTRPLPSSFHRRPRLGETPRPTAASGGSRSVATAWIAAILAAHHASDSPSHHPPTNQPTNQPTNYSLPRAPPNCDTAGDTFSFYANLPPL